MLYFSSFSQKKISIEGNQPFNLYPFVITGFWTEKKSSLSWKKIVITEFNSQIKIQEMFTF